MTKLKYDSKHVTGLLNDILLLSNFFDGDSFARLMFFCNDPSSHSKVKTYLLFLRRLPYYVPEVDISVIPTDKCLLDIMNEL